MKLKLKSVKHSPSFSEETNCFKADLWVGNKKIAYISNDGRGGCTFYNAYDGMIPLLKEAEVFALTLPSTEAYGHVFKMNLEHHIDDLFEDWANNKQLTKQSNKGILYRDKDGKEFVYSWKGCTMKKLLNSPNGIDALREVIKMLKSEGATILNNNLGSLI